MSADQEKGSVVQFALYRSPAIFTILSTSRLQSMSDTRCEQDIRVHRGVVTERFYRIREWDPERYTLLADRYGFHVELVQDLILELTRAANYVCLGSGAFGPPEWLPKAVLTGVGCMS